MTSPRPAGDLCLKCDKKWRNKLQHFLNQISGPSRRNPLILGSDVKRITKAICTCISHSAWNEIQRGHINEAHSRYTSSQAFQTNYDGRPESVHKEFYTNLSQAGLFFNHHSISSADRLIYVLSCKAETSGTVRVDILDKICPRTVRPVGDTVHIGSLKVSHRGRYVGRGGTGIREAVHGTPVGHITIRFSDPDAQNNVQVYATFSSRRRNARRVVEGLQTRARYYQEDMPVPFRERDRFNSRGITAQYLYGSYAGPSGYVEQEMDSN